MQSGSLSALFEVSDTACCDRCKVMVVGGDLESQQQFQPVPEEIEVTVVDATADAVTQLTLALQQGSPYAVVVIGERVQSAPDRVQCVDALRRVDPLTTLLFLSDPVAEPSMDALLQPGDLTLRKPIITFEVNQAVSHLCQRWSLQQQAKTIQQRVDGTLKLVLESMDEAVLISDEMGTLLYVNRAATQLFSSSEDEMVVTPLPAIQRLLQHKPTPSRGETILENYEGIQIPVHYAYRYWNNQQEGKQRRVLVLSDRSHQIRVGAREQYAAYQSGVAEMSANILHHTGNTIQSTLTSFGALADGVEDLNLVREVFHQTQQEIESAVKEGEAEKVVALSQLLGGKISQALSTLTEEMTHSAQKVRHGLDQVTTSIRTLQQGPKLQGDISRFSLAQLVDDLLLLTAAELNNSEISLKQEMGTGLPEVRLPRNQLLQVLTALIRNSIEAIDERVIHDRLMRGAGEIWIKVIQNKEGEIEMVVEDNGDGFSAENMPKLMRYGYTTKYNNQGVGLHVAGNFVNSVGGALQLNSGGVGEGAVARLLLPQETGFEGKSPG